MNRVTWACALAVLAHGLWGCGSSSDDSSSSPDAGVGSDGAGGTDSTIGPDGSSGPDSGARPDSGGGPDASDGSTTDGSTGDGAMPLNLPIKHVVVVVKENHTFDNYFGTFPGAEGTTTFKMSTGQTGMCPQAPNTTSRDLCHTHDCALQDWNGGMMNGFDLVSTTSQGGDNLGYAQYHESDLPNYWAYARKYALGDHFFANVLGPSFPGHMFVLAAQSGWTTGNPNTQILHPYWGCDQDPSTTAPILSNGTCTAMNVFPCFKIPSIPDVLPSGVDWKFYGSDFYFLGEIWSMFDGIDKIRNGPGWMNVVNADNTFDGDVDSGKLPAVSWLVNQDLADEHPNVGGVCQGENWTVGHLNHIMQSPLWMSTAIIFTMDDFGGWYDHVPPPRQYGCNATTPYGLGFRLPLIIISPYAKPASIFKEVSEQASIPRFIEKVFGASHALSDLDPAAQDGQANDLLNAFDFTQTPLAPTVLPQRSCP